MDEYELYMERASSFWQRFGTELLLRLDEARVPICKYRCFLSNDLSISLVQEKIGRVGVDISFEQVKYKKGNKKGARIRTRWLSKPFHYKKNRKILSHRILDISPVYVRAKGKKSYGQPKDLVYAYFILIHEKNNKHEWSLRLYFIEALWNGVPVRKKQFEGESEESFPNGFVLPRSIIAAINRCLSCNYLPQLWIGKPYAGWIHTAENVSFYMGANLHGNQKMQDTVPPITDLCRYPAGAVLLAFTCFSILKPFFLSYHQLDKNTSYLKVKRSIDDIISINIHGDKPEYAENLARACCDFFDLRSPDKIAAIIDGIDIQRLSSRSLSFAKLTVGGFESKILQPACVLWLNREPTAELLQSGRIIDVYTEPFGKHEEFETISEYIVETLSWAIYEKSEQGKCYSFDDIGKEATLIESFLEEIKKYVDYQPLARILSGWDFDIAEEKEYWHGREPFRFGSAKRYVKSILRRIDRCIDEYIDDYCDDHGIDCQHNMSCTKGEDCVEKGHCEKWGLLVRTHPACTIMGIRAQIHETAKKYILELGRIDRAIYKKHFIFDSQHKAAMKSLKQIAASRYLDDNIVKKLAYLSASFKIFEEMCLSKQRKDKKGGGFNDCLIEGSACLSKKIDQALVSVASKQMLDSPTNILKRYILNQIRDGHFARIRGKRSDDKDVTVWYDPEKELFFLRAKTYYDELCKEHNLRITKNQFEDELAWDNAIVSTERKKGEGTQIRRSHEIKIAANGSKESVLKIRKSLLSASIASESVILEAIETMTADTTSLRKKNIVKA